MRRVQGRWLVAWLALLSLPVALLLTRAPEPGWTVMVYMVGADIESTEGAAARDLTEMQRAVRGDTTLLVMTGGSGNPAGQCAVYRVTRDTRELLSAAPGSMGDPASLRRLLETGNAERKGPSALILWDHGFGPLEGFGEDGRSPDRRLTLAETAQALREAGCAELPLSLIGFDACFMGSCETAVTLAPYAGCLVASQETAPEDGWNYASLAALEPRAEAEAFGRRIVADYTETCRKTYEQYPELEEPYTLALTDLREADALRDGISGFLGFLRRELAAGRYSEISQVRLKTWGVGLTSTTTAYDLVDLQAQAEAYRDRSSEARTLLAVLQRCVLAHGGNIEGANGLSIWIPYYSKEEARSSWLVRLGELELPEAWSGFLRDYSTAQAEGPQRTGPLVSSLELSEEQLRDYARVKYYVLQDGGDGSMCLVYAANDASLEGRTVRVAYDGRMLAISAKGRQLPLVSFWMGEDSRSAYYLSYLAGIPDLDNPGWQRVFALPVVRDRQTGEWHARNAFDRTGELVTGRQEFSLKEIQELMIGYPFRTPVYDEWQNPLPWEEWTPAGSGRDFLDIRDGFTLEEIPLPRSEGERYWLQVILVDTYNRETVLELKPLEEK